MQSTVKSDSTRVRTACGSARVERNPTDHPRLAQDRQPREGLNYLERLTKRQAVSISANWPPANAGGSDLSEHLIFRDGVVPGENNIKLDFTSPILTSYLGFRETLNSRL